MKNKSVFSQIIFLIIVGVLCFLLTFGVALLAGSLNAELFDFKNLNFSNMVPVLIIGIFISCVIIGLGVLFVAKSAFLNVKNFFCENDKDKNIGGKEK